MIWNYDEVIKKVGNRRALNKALKNKDIYKVSKGVYSDEEFPELLEIVAHKYDDFILTMQSAFEFYGLTDYFTDKVTVALVKGSFKKNSDLIERFYSIDSLYNIGVKVADYKGEKIKIYDLERLLIELIRKKNKLSLDEYYHVLGNFKERKEDINIRKVMEYADYFREYQNIERTIRDVFL